MGDLQGKKGFCQAARTTNAEPWDINLRFDAISWIFNTITGYTMPSIVYKMTFIGCVMPSRGY